MILEPVRCCADWLASATTGIGPALATVPRDAGDALPATPAVVDETRTGWVARRERPQELRSLVCTVVQESAAVMPAESVAVFREARVTLAVQVWSPLVDSAAAGAALHYTVRAVLRSLRAWMRDDDAGLAGRTRNQTVILGAEEWSVLPVESSPEDALSVVTLLLPLTVRDQAPEA